MPNVDKYVTPSVTQKLQELGYNVADWDDSQTKVPEEFKKVFSTSSKFKLGQKGYPDRVYVNKGKKLMVLVEEKPTVKSHFLEDKTKGAVSGIKWYLSRFLNKNLSEFHNELVNYFNSWKMIGIAVSGNILSEYNNQFNAFFIDTRKQELQSIPQLKNFVADDDYLAVFNNLNEEEAINQISAASKKINVMLRPIDSQKRPILLSALMIGLYIPKDKDGNYKLGNNDFPEQYRNYSPETITSNLTRRVKDVLEAEGIPSQKIKSLDSELAFINDDKELNSKDILKNILITLDESVIPLFSSKFSSESNYDIIGRFYEEFLRFAGISNVKKGIVLTPRHIAGLFTKLVPIKTNDVIMDLACGTGAFLIAGMNVIINKINESGVSNKREKITEVKKKQLLGFEINPTMYILYISNMLFRHDGKSAIYNMDSIHDDDVNTIINKFSPTIGFINPPYSGKENKKDPTPKEITFIRKMLDNCSRYGVVIAPTSTFFKDNQLRKNILKKHRLMYVIKMPDNLFMPNAATHTTIAVFETNSPHNFTKDKVAFYDLKDDGYVLTKNKGRTDSYNRWHAIENNLLRAVVDDEVKSDNVTYVRKLISPDDEWTVQQHLDVSYATLSTKSFTDTVDKFIIFNAKREMGILDKDLTDFQLFTALNGYFNGNIEETINMVDKKIDTSSWKEFKLCGKNGMFNIKRGKRLTIPNREEGDVPFITAGATNQGWVQNVGNYKWNETVEPCITVDMFGNSFYQNYNFQCDDNIFCFRNKHVNTYIAMFIVTVLGLQIPKYDYGRQFRDKHAKATYIKLPAKSDGTPDYDYMVNFIKNLPNSEYLE